MGTVGISTSLSTLNNFITYNLLLFIENFTSITIDRPINVFLGPYVSLRTIALVDKAVPQACATHLLKITSLDQIRKVNFDRAQSIM